MQISRNTAVSIDYVLKGDDGAVIDTSTDGQFIFLVGANNIIPGLESALLGKEQGDDLEVSIEAADAYGEIDPSRMQTVSRDVFPEDSDIHVGAQFHGAGPDGNPVAITVASVEGDEIVIDGNHALAGKTLHFSVKVVNVRAASEEELAHGHIHGPGCNH